MLRHLRLNVLGLVGVLATGATALDGWIDRDLEQAWFAGWGCALLALLWRWAVQHAAEADRVAPPQTFNPQPQRPVPAQRAELKARLASCARHSRARGEAGRQLTALTHAALRG